MAEIAGTPSGTTRCLLPLPVHLQKLDSRCKSASCKFATSETRLPVA